MLRYLQILRWVRLPSRPPRQYGYIFFWAERCLLLGSNGLLSTVSAHGNKNYRILVSVPKPRAVVGPAPMCCRYLIWILVLWYMLSFLLPPFPPPSPFPPPRFCFPGGLRLFPPPGPLGAVRPWVPLQTTGRSESRCLFVSGSVDPAALARQVSPITAPGNRNIVAMSPLHSSSSSSR